MSAVLDSSIASKRHKPKGHSEETRAKVKEELEAGKTPDNVSMDLRTSVIKEVGARWLVSLYDYFLSNLDKIKNGFVQAGITEAITNPNNFSE